MIEENIFNKNCIYHKLSLLTFDFNTSIRIYIYFVIYYKKNIENVKNIILYR